MPVRSTDNSFQFDFVCRDKVLSLGRSASQAVVMGILNVTPDSFSDGGRYEDVDRALARASEMVEEGAAIIDVGGASSRPAGRTYGEGASILSASEEIHRVVPVIEAIRERYPTLVISIDTFQSPVAAAALGAGADIVNDITALQYRGDMAGIVRKTGAGLILMHTPSNPEGLSHEYAGYTDVVSDVIASLQERVCVAYRAGISNVCIDPGFGFGKSIAGNYSLLKHLDEFLRLGLPILVGVSRKSMIGAAVGSAQNPVAVGERVIGSAAAAAYAVVSGASIIRTHDVRETIDVLKVLSAIETEQVT